jgi:phosphate transport system substrate-binding protein
VICAGQIDVAGASRPMGTTEIAQCEAKSVELIEIPFAFDSLAVGVHPAASFVECLTVAAELRKMWESAAEKKVTNWRQIRDSSPIVRSCCLVRAPPRGRSAATAMRSYRRTLSRFS